MTLEKSDLLQVFVGFYVPMCIKNRIQRSFVIDELNLWRGLTNKNLMIYEFGIIY